MVDPATARAQREGTRSATPSRRRAGRAMSRCWSATRSGWRNLCRLLTRAHAHTRESPGRRRVLAPLLTVADLAEHAEGLVCLSGCADRGVHDEPTARALLAAFGRDAFRIELQRPFRRHDRARNRALAELAARLGVPCVATGNVHAHDARARAAAGRRSWRSASTRRSTPPSRCAAATTPTSSPRRRRWRRASRTIPRRSPRRRAWPPTLIFDLTADLGYRYPGAEDGDADRELAAVCAGLLRRALPDGHRLRADATARLDQELALIRDLGLSGFFLLHHEMLELAREVAAEVRGDDVGAQPAAAGARARLLGLVDRLLPHRPLARRPDRQRPAPRALPQRGHHVAARHRPRLPARRARGADPAGARALRAGALGARRGLPDLPRARRDPRARQGAGAAAGGDRAGRALLGGVLGADRRPRHRRRAGRGPRGRRPLALAARAGRRGPRPAAPSQPALGRDDRRDAPADRLLPGRARRDGGPADGDVGQGLLLGRGLPEDRPARARDAVGGRALRGDDRARGAASGSTCRGSRWTTRRRSTASRRPRRPASSRSRAARRWARCAARGPKPEGPDDPGGDRAARADRRRRGQPLHRAPPAAAGGPVLRGALRPPVAEGRAGGHARDDHLPGPGHRGRDGVRRAVAAGGRGPAAGDEPQALGRGDRGLPRALRRQAMAAWPDVDEELAERVWTMVKGFSGFGFPKAHGAAFGLLAYQSTWLRVHYGTEFLAALLDEQPMGFYPPDALVHEAQRRGIEVLAPDVNASAVGCTVVKVDGADAVRIGLGYVLGVRADDVEALVAAREAGGPFRSVEDLASRAGAGRPALEQLAWSGACDALAGGNRRRALWELGVAAPGKRLLTSVRRAASGRRDAGRAGDAARAAAGRGGGAAAAGPHRLGGDDRRLLDHRADDGRASAGPAARRAARAGHGHQRRSRAAGPRGGGAPRRAGRRSAAAGDGQGRRLHADGGRDRDGQPDRAAEGLRARPARRPRRAAGRGRGRARAPCVGGRGDQRRLPAAVAPGRQRPAAGPAGGRRRAPTTSPRSPAASSGRAETSSRSRTSRCSTRSSWPARTPRGRRRGRRGSRRDGHRRLPRGGAAGQSFASGRRR